MGCYAGVFEGTRGIIRHALPSLFMAAALALLSGFACLPAMAAPVDIAECSVVVEDAVYSGKPLYPSLSVRYEGRQLEKGRDFATSWHANVNAGIGSVMITGKGAFAGSMRASFSIAKADIRDADVSGISASYTASGRAIEPEPKVVFGGKTLKRERDYTVSYAGNMAPGSATLTITGIRNLTGTRAFSFTITAAPANAGAKQEASSPSKASTTTSSKASSSTSAKASTTTSSKVITTTSSKASRSATTKTSSSAKKAKTKDARRDIAKASATKPPTQYYTGKKLKPAITVKDGSRTLRQGSDYTISYTANTNPGTAHATITGKGSYKGTKRVEFTIEALGARLARKACALSYSRPAGHREGYNGTSAYLKAWHATIPGDWAARSCDRGVAVPILAAGYDKDFPRSLIAQKKYFNWPNGKPSSKKWKRVGTYHAGDEKSRLQPGDIVVRDSHVCMYVGEDIAKSVYRDKLKDKSGKKGADRGKPTGSSCWASAHRRLDDGYALCIGKTSYARPTRSSQTSIIYRCVKPDWA